MFRFGQPGANGSYRIKPSKGLMAVTTPIALLILAFGVVTMVRSHHPNYAFLAVWLVVGLAMLGFNLWAAFSKRGSLYQVDNRP
jgi:hypothetical protein